MMKYILLIISLAGPAFTALTKPDGCGSSVGCYTDCDGGSCTYVVTWADDGTNVKFTLQYTLPNPAQDYWIALGLSGDKKMGDDSVTDCIKSGTTINVHKSYNKDGDKRNEALPENELQTGLTNPTGSVADGVLSCTYTQSKTSSHSKIKDLNTDWYLLVATGTTSNDVKMQHSLSPLPDISPDKVNLQSTDDLSGTATNVKVKVHGCLMLYAWVFAASIGIVLARYYKRMWPNTTHCREKVWFTWHRVMMLTAFGTCIAAFVIIFIEAEGWADLEGASRWQKAHPYIGVIVTALCIINPIMALLRPHPDARYRSIFNWSHWLVGTLAHVLSIIALIIGVTLEKASTPFYVVWILIAYAAYQTLMELFLEIHACCTAGSGDRYYRDGTMKDPRGSRLKKVLLVIHVLIITGFTAACIIIVAIN